VADADVDALCAAMDWRLERQGVIEQRLAKRHLHEAGRVLYDLSSSYFEGERCPLAVHAYSRDGKKGKRQVNDGLLTNAAGCQVAISAFKGNTSNLQIRPIRNQWVVPPCMFVFPVITGLFLLIPDEPVLQAALPRSVITSAPASRLSR